MKLNIGSLIKFDPCQKAIRSLNRVGAGLSTQAPNILLGAGTVGTIVSAVLVGVASTKLPAVIDLHKEEIKRINEALENKEVYEDGVTEYSEKDAKHDKTISYTRLIARIGKLYGPAATTLLLSLTCFYLAHGIMKSRNAALVAAYKVVETSYLKLKKDGKAKFGAEFDKLLYGYEETEIEKTITDENGKKKKIKLKKVEPTYTGADMYGRWFNKTSPYCTENGLYNEDFLLMTERMFNDQLKTKGWVLLNDVYKSLGFPETSIGAQVGWIYKGEGDGYIDFGIHDFDATIGEHKSCQAFNDCSGNCKNCPGRYWIFLDFNVDGYILDKIGNANKLNKEYVNESPLLSPENFDDQTFI